MSLASSSMFENKKKKRRRKRKKLIEWSRERRVTSFNGFL